MQHNTEPTDLVTAIKVRIILAGDHEIAITKEEVQELLEYIEELEQDAGVSAENDEDDEPDTVVRPPKARDPRAARFTEGGEDEDFVFVIKDES